MKKTFSIFIILFLFLISGNTQSRSYARFSKNSVFAEANINKDLDFYSMLYDRIITTKGFVKFGLQTGLAFSTKITSGSKNYATFFPVKAYLLFGKHTHFVETGLGLRIHGFAYPEASINYRFKQFYHGFTGRIGYSGIFMPAGLQNMASLSVGYTF